MKVAQIATILNNVINAEQIGDSIVVNEDLTNIVDVGKALYDSASNPTGYDLNKNFDNFIGKMIDQIGRITFVNRVYRSQAPKILVDSWEYGSILMKVRAEIPDAANNATWTLAGQSIEATTGATITAPTTVDPFVITKPDVDAKFFNSKTTFEIPITIAEIQLKEAFRSAGEMNRFVSMIQNRISLKATLSSDAMVMRTINNLIAQKLGSVHNVVNLLTEYKAATGNATITSATAMSNPEFLRYASKTIMMYKKFLNNASLLYNEDGYVTFTPDDRLRAVMLADFSKALEVYLYSDTYHNEFVTLDGYTEVPYWQGTGDVTTSDSIENSFVERSTINVKTLLDGSSTTVNQTGVIGVLFDEEAAVVCNDNQRVTSIWNPKGEYWNYFYKYDCSYLNDTAENCIVFIIDDADDTPENFNVAGKSGTIFGVNTNKIQSGITVTGNKISGTLIKDTDNDAFTNTWGKGYFIALQFSGTAATTDTKVGVLPSSGSGLVNLDSDKDALFKLNNPKAQKIVVVIDGVTYVYDISGLTLT